MSPETRRAALRRTISSGDWNAVERAARAYGWSLVLQALRRALAWLARMPAGRAAPRR
jgi:hypothetical protein